MRVLLCYGHSGHHLTRMPFSYYYYHAPTTGGYQFNQKTGKYMRALFKGELHPYIFHMSWTFNKDNKLLYFRQIGEWYVDDTCIQKKAEVILNAHGGNANSDIGGGMLIGPCCHAEPIVSCHYRDKPSIIPCHGSPPIDKGKPSWWGRTATQ